MNDLREDLDRALRTVTFGEAPVERTKRHGRRIRTRRRIKLLAGALAVAVVAVVYPVLGRSSAAPPAPVTGQRGHTPPAGQDPVITDGPPAGTTQAAGGLATKTGLIAQGTVGGVKWQASVHPPGPSNTDPKATCYTVTLSSPSGFGSMCDESSVSLTDALNGNPAAFTGQSEKNLEVMFGAVAKNVTYFIVTFNDSQQIKLIPVTAYGIRYIAWVAPASMTIELVEAHLGGPYSDSGQSMNTAPFDLPGQVPSFGLWQKSGVSAPPRDSKVIGHGSAGGHAWSVTAYEGPWGTCFVTSTGSTDCVPIGGLSSTAILGGWGGNPPGPAFGSAAPGAALVRFKLSDGSTVQARPVLVGNEDLFAFQITKNVEPTSWTAYDASGKEVGAGSMASASIAVTTPATP